MKNSRNLVVRQHASFEETINKPTIIIDEAPLIGSYALQHAMQEVQTRLHVELERRIQQKSLVEIENEST